MKKNVLLLVLVSPLFFFSCGKMEPYHDSKNEKSIIKDTIKNISELELGEAIWNDNGIYRKVSKIEDTDPEDTNEEELANRSSGCSSSYSGVDRKVAKISFSSATTKTHYTFNAFRKTLQTDDYMRSLGISTSSTSGRVSQEDRNIYITTSYLYAIKSESDGDFHMIIGDPSKAALTNCEASGLPSTKSSAYSKIKAVKDAIITRFETDFCGTSSYTIFSPPILIDKIYGSLFYDVDHAAGVVGPKGYRPTTSWEVHPISFIQF
jgi:hypothetical protein